eukprot:gnl/Trimastix_PCT/1632.p1 GENE.gnl/Trimastix_PCT/1632~~gnl/Trimastix_PCT/1632.p1  ORF type:complete len:517 (+),score=120.87 gnl/Trimastix_PCT/1632:18-1568(+)
MDRCWLVARRMSDTESSLTQQPVRFVSRDPAYEAPESTIHVPATATRKLLSRVLNQLLDLESPVTFDFLIKGTLLRTSLEKFLERREMSTEDAAELEFFEALPPPEQAHELPHEDGIICCSPFVSKQGSSHILTGCFDGSLHAWDLQGTHLMQHQAHDYPITTVTCTSNGSHIITGAKDHTLSLWRWAGLQSPVQYVCTLVGHTDSVQCTALSPGRRPVLATGGWDHTIRLWSLSDALAHRDTEKTTIRTSSADGDDDTTEALAGRKRGAEPLITSVRRRRLAREVSPVAELTGHRACVSALLYGYDTYGTPVTEQPDTFNPALVELCLWSASWDHSLFRWNLETRSRVLEMHAPCAALCLASNHALTHAQQLVKGGSPDPASPGLLLLSGHVDGAARVWDPRQAQGSVSRPYRGHDGFVTGVAWAPSSPYHFSSCGHDGKTILWDIRSRRPLHAKHCTQEAPQGPEGEETASLGDTEPNHLQCQMYAHLNGADRMACGGDDGRLYVLNVSPPSVS